MLPSSRAPAQVQVMLCRRGEFAESPLAEDCARAVSPSLESISRDSRFPQCKGVQDHDRGGGSALNLCLCFFSHPVPQESRHWPPWRSA